MDAVELEQLLENTTMDPYKHGYHISEILELDIENN